MNVKRNLLTSTLLSILFGVGAAGAAEPSDLARLGYFGAQVQSRPEAPLKITSATEDIYVDHFATARIENDKGQSFTWRFDSTMAMASFPLKAIAPSGFDAGNTVVIPNHPASHYAQ